MESHNLIRESDLARSISFLSNASAMEAPSATSQDTASTDGFINTKSGNDLPRKSTKNQSAEIAVEDSCHTLSDVCEFLREGCKHFNEILIDRERPSTTLLSGSSEMDHLALSFRYENEQQY